MAFHHTLRTLGAMRLQRHAVLVLLLVGLLGVWGTWLVMGRMTVYVRSDTGRLEIQQSVVVVNTPVDGVVVDCALSLGRQVVAGDVLVKLDAHAFELQVQEKRAEVASRRALIASVDHQVEVEEQARVVVAKTVSQTARMGRVRVAANQKDFERKQQENDVMARLREASLASKLEAMRSSSETESLRMQAALLTEQALLDTSNATTTLRDREVKIAQLKRDLVGANSELALQEARLATLEFEVERRTLRATTEGTLADVVTCTPGMTVTPTTRLATLLPHGEIRMVAFFKASESIGRVRQGQRAVVRVDNFPWTQYGTLTARVSEVGTEPRDGRVRVELSVPPQIGPIPAMHGLVGTTEVATESISPAQLLLRLAGQPWAGAAPSVPESGKPQPLADTR